MGGRHVERSGGKYAAVVLLEACVRGKGRRISKPRTKAAGGEKEDGKRDLIVLVCLRMQAGQRQASFD